jgi:hypothetical protein
MEPTIINRYLDFKCETQKMYDAIHHECQVSSADRHVVLLQALNCTEHDFINCGMHTISGMVTAVYWNVALILKNQKL